MIEARHAVRVWDLPIRLFHWLAAALVAAAYATWRLNWMEWHGWIGDALLVLLIFRLLWGFFGSEPARFARFLAPPRAAWQYLAHARRREPDRLAGHNPAGGWMAVLLLALLFGETLSGLYVANDIADVGPLTDITPAPVADTIDALHTILWDALLAGVGVHVLAILFYAAAKGHNLLPPMITGRKMLPADVPQPTMAGAGRALALLAASAIAAAAIVNFL
jgi:cytochrome b